MPFPQAAGAAEGRQAAFGGKAGAGEDDDVADGVHGEDLAPGRESRQSTNTLEAVAAYD